MGRRYKVWLEYFILIVILLCFFNPFHCYQYDDSDTESESETASQVRNKQGPTLKPSSAEKYKLRFSQYRGLQTQAMQSVLKKVEKKDLRDLLSTMLANLFKIMLESRANLTKVGYVAGDEFPDDKETKESLSNVLENTFMFGDLLLQRPRAVHAVYDEHQDWQDTLKWAHQICSKCGVFNLEEQQYLDLMSKEAGILPKEENFKNPYLDESEKPRKKFEDPKPVEKRKPKKPQRGPRLSHTEL